MTGSICSSTTTKNRCNGGQLTGSRSRAQIEGLRVVYFLNDLLISHPSCTHGAGLATCRGGSILRQPGRQHSGCDVNPARHRYDCLLTTGDL